MNKLLVYLVSTLVFNTAIAGVLTMLVPDIRSGSNSFIRSASVFPLCPSTVGRSPS